MVLLLCVCTVLVQCMKRTASINIVSKACLLLSDNPTIFYCTENESTLSSLLPPLCHLPPLPPPPPSLPPHLASTSVEDSLEALPQTSTPESKTHTTRTSEKKPPILELSPLVGDSDREETPVSETDTGPRVSRLYSIPETPV